MLFPNVRPPFHVKGAIPDYIKERIPSEPRCDGRTDQRTREGIGKKKKKRKKKKKKVAGGSCVTYTIRRFLNKKGDVGFLALLLPKIPIGAVRDRFVGAGSVEEGPSRIADVGVGERIEEGGPGKSGTGIRYTHMYTVHK